MVDPQPKNRGLPDPHARWFIEVLWYNDEKSCWVRSWAHHHRIHFVGDRGFRTLDAAYRWAVKELRGFLFPEGPGLPSLRVRFYWSKTGPATDTRTIVEVYDLGGDVL